MTDETLEILCFDALAMQARLDEWKARARSDFAVQMAEDAADLVRRMRERLLQQAKTHAVRVETASDARAGRIMVPIDPSPDMIVAMNEAANALPGDVWFNEAVGEWVWLLGILGLLRESSDAVRRHGEPSGADDGPLTGSLVRAARRIWAAGKSSGRKSTRCSTDRARRSPDTHRTHCESNPRPAPRGSSYVRSTAMADYFVQFSCMLDVGSADNVARTHDIRNAFATEINRDEESCLGFEMELAPEGGPGALWIHSDEHGEPEHVIVFVLRCAEAFQLSGLWGFRWALTCSKPRLDGFGGGAQLLDLGQRESVAGIDCEGWLEDRFVEHLAPDAGFATVTATTSAAGGAQS